MKIKIRRTHSDFEREPLLSPFGFKGGYLDELWQSVALMESGEGFASIGLGTQSVLWSDGEVFARSSQSAGNALMFMLTEYALKAVEGTSFGDPLELLEEILPRVYEYGKKITGNPHLRKTFALNALVAVDNAAWLQYAHANGMGGFDEMIPLSLRPALSAQHSRLAEVPLIPYGMKEEQVAALADEGFAVLKIKIGSDPAGDGDQQKMLEWDKQRLASLHAILGERTTQYTDNGRIAYYIDANGRYAKKETLLRLLEYADRIGALERIAILEEPFSEDNKTGVWDIPARVAADESAHSDQDAAELIGLGYGAIALKPIAKTLSMTLKILDVAYKSNIPCFCADLTVNPILADWNKNVAARIGALPGLKTGIIETNGRQNYLHWDALCTYHPDCGASWRNSEGGIYTLDGDFYAQSGGIFKKSEHYCSLMRYNGG